MKKQPVKDYLPIKRMSKFIDQEKSEAEEDGNLLFCMRLFSPDGVRMQSSIAICGDVRLLFDGLTKLMIDDPRFKADMMRYCRDVAAPGYWERAMGAHEYFNKVL